jgi:hypothetical protein
MELPEEVKQYFRQSGSEGGKKAASNMTRAARVARAKKASKAAQKGRKKPK